MEVYKEKTLAEPSFSDESHLHDPLSADEARNLTEEVKSDAQALWRKLLILYEGGAHKALGYSSWADYFEAEFGQGSSQAYRVLEAGRVARAIEGHSPTGEYLSERYARELAPLAKEDPVAAGELWAELVEEHGENLTAEKVQTATRTLLKREKELGQLSPAVADVVREIDPADVDLPTSTRQLNYLAGVEDEADQLEIAIRVADGSANTVWEASKQLKEEFRELARVRRREAAEVGDIQKKAGTITANVGEWWRLGDHLLFCGDSASEEFKQSLSDAALAFADPPYNASVAEWDHNFYWSHDYLADATDVVAVTPGIGSLRDFLRITEMPYRWSVAGFISNGMTRGAVGYGNWIYAAIFSYHSVYRQSQDAVRFSISTSESSETRHKGRKPGELMSYIVETFSEEGETVIDPFLGSGQTLLACERLGRKCVGAEIEPRFCAEIIHRWESLSGSKAQRVER